MSTPSRQPKVFLSYAREDRASAARVCEGLRDRNRNVWFDQDSIRGGERWRQAIERAIRDSDFFVALLSDVSVSKRGTVQAELKRALEVLDELPDDRVFLIPTRLTPCEPSHARVRELQWIDLFPVWDDGLTRLVLATEPVQGGADDTGPTPPFRDFAHIEGEVRFDTQRAEVRVSELVQQAIAAVREYAAARQIGVEVRDEAPGAKIRVPAEPVVWAMTNVLHNALKYSYTSPDPAPVEVTIRPQAELVRVDFTNIGVGLLPQEANSIFNYGYSARDAKQPSLGQGLGLWFAKNFLQDVQGDIRIESRPLRTDVAKIRTPFLTRVSILLVRVPA